MFCFSETYIKHKYTYTKYRGQTEKDDAYYIEDIQFDECTSFWDIPPNYCDHIDIDLIKWSEANISHINTQTVNEYIHGWFSIQKEAYRQFAPIYYYERIIVTVQVWTFGLAVRKTNFTLSINEEPVFSEAVANYACPPSWTTVEDNPITNLTCLRKVHIEYLISSKDPIAVSGQIQCDGSDCAAHDAFKWGFNEFCLDAQLQLTRDPTPAPTSNPTAAPTYSPTRSPTLAPTSAPSRAPSSMSITFLAAKIDA